MEKENSRIIHYVLRAYTWKAPPVGSGAVKYLSQTRAENVNAFRLPLLLQIPFLFLVQVD